MIFSEARVAAGICNGTFGELLQGVLPEDKKFLVNLKIKNRSRALLRLSSRNSPSESPVQWQDLRKSYAVLKRFLADFGCNDLPSLEIESDIPIGKGLGSSTADAVATLKAAEAALSVSVDGDYMSRLLTSVEPNDGIHFAGTAAYHHAIGELVWRCDFVPPVQILGVDFGGTVDTVAFNSVSRTWSLGEMKKYEELLSRMHTALESENLLEIFDISTESALLWQKTLPKEGLVRMIELAKQTGALGVVNAHSGSYIGLVYGPDLALSERERLSEEAARWTGGLQAAWFETVTFTAPAGR